MPTITDIADGLNKSKIGLYLTFDANESEDVLYILKSTEGGFDIELDESIGHLANYNSYQYGDFQGWVCYHASVRASLLLSALNRYWDKKQRFFNSIKVC